MRVAISADTKNGLDSVVSPHFGRCPHFVLVDVQGDQVNTVNVVDNPYYGNHEPGQVPDFIHSLGANVMLTGGMGQRAIMFFQQYGIEAATGAFGTARQSLERYLGGQLRGAESCSESKAHGQGATPAPGEYEKDEIGRLREEVDLLRRGLDEVAGRLARL
jgi:predicted Fe-Mo cluster-binding NifX family protein